MADSFKISELPELTTASDDDLLVIVDQPGSSGFAETKKISRANMVKALATKDELATKATLSHTHDDRYYTETEADALLTAKSNTGHTHTSSQVGLSNVPNVDATVRGSHTGTQSADSITDGTTNKAYTTVNHDKLAGIATGSTQNATNAQLRDRSTHTGTQTAGTISDFVEAVQDTMSSTIVAGTNIGVAYDDTSGSVTITAVSGGGGTNSTNLTTSPTSTAVTILSDTGTDASIPAADSSNAGVMTSADRTKLDGVASGATANDTNANLRARSSHTGSQAISTVTGLQTTLDGKSALAHSHAISDVTGLSGALAAKSDAVHTHGSTDVTDFAEAVDDRINVSIVAGTGITKTYDDAANTLTLTAATGGSNATNLTTARTSTAVTVNSDTGTDAAIPAADGTNAGVMTAAQQTKLAGVATSADVTSATNVGTSINGATAKTTPVDADTMPLIDSAASNVLKKVTWANFKATLKTYTDTLYAAVSHSHAIADVTSLQTALDGKATLPTQTGNSGKFLKTDGTALSWDTPAGGGGGGSVTTNEFLILPDIAANNWTASTSGTFSAGASAGSHNIQQSGDGTARTTTGMATVSTQYGGTAGIAPTSFFTRGNIVVAPYLASSFTATTSAHIRWVTEGAGFENANIATARHIGFLLELTANGSGMSQDRIRMSSANGTVQQISTIDLFTPNQKASQISVIRDPSTLVLKFYIDGILKATHATSIPDFTGINQAPLTFAIANNQSQSITVRLASWQSYFAHSL